MRVECRYSLLWNCAAVFAAVFGAALLCPGEAYIGTALYLTDGAMSIILMKLLEKYNAAVSGLYEKTVITCLSSAFTFIFMCVLNIIFFMSAERLAIDAALAVLKAAAVFLTDFLLTRLWSNEKRYKKPSLLIIGSAETNFQRMKKIKYGVLKNESIGGMSGKELEDFVKTHYPRCDAVCIFDELSGEKYRTAMKTALEMNKDLFIVPKIADVSRTNTKTVLLDDVLTLYIPRKALSGFQLFIKRTADISAASIGLIVLAVPMAAIALAIKITSPGPIIYRQTRLTKDKRRFEIYKFRTMVPDAEKLSGPRFAEKNDPRITPIGKFLRSCRLDELPQLINVLKNDMSLVGPRPERPVFAEKFEKEIESYDCRFEVKAGLTGLSHVYGRYSTYIYDRTYYDLFYITHYSLMLDFKILLLTAKTLFVRSAAEGEDEFGDKLVDNSGVGGEN